MKKFDFDLQLSEHSSYLQAYAYKLTQDKSAAMDLYQETTLKALKYQDKFMPYTNMRAWLCTIMKNTHINSFRRTKRKRNIFQERQQEVASYALVGTASNTGEHQLAVEEIQTYIDRLDSSLKTPFVLSVEGFKYHEIADELQIPIGTVKSRIFLARKELREKLSVFYPHRRQKSNEHRAA